GVHVCVVLATLPDDAALAAAKLAEYHGVPAAYLAKHLQTLAGAGVLRTVKGARGGYRLARPPADITVLDVVEAIDGEESAFRCSEVRRRGPLAMPAREYTKPCGIHSALTGLPVPSEYEAAVGVASLPDERLLRLTEMSRSKKTVAAGFELVNLALPPVSKPGEGLGAKFLGALRNCDAILIVLRAFADGGVVPDPEGDLVALELEL